MSILDIFRKKTASTPIPSPTAPSKVVEITPAPPPKPVMTLASKINLYLHYALESLNDGDGWMPQTYVDGTPMMVKGINLAPMVLDMFDLVVVAKLQNGTIFYDFLSKKYTPNYQLRVFIDSCYNAFGPDKYGRCNCSQADVEPLKYGKFFRNWENIDILQTRREDHFSLVIAMRITINPQDR